jgi:hypothetical protein
MVLKFSLRGLNPTFLRFLLFYQKFLICQESRSISNPSLKGADVYGSERDASENLRTRTHYIALM